jgi:hypothetical protein
VAELPKPDLIKLTEIFLVPSSFLVAALGTADTNPHRAGVSLLGLIISGLWLVCIHDALADFSAEQSAETERKPLPRRTRILTGLPWIFSLGWFGTLIAHLVLWNQPLGAHP